MEGKQACEVKSEEPKGHIIETTNASLGPPRPEPLRQFTRGLLSRTKSRANQPEEIRPEPTPETQSVLPKTELPDVGVGIPL